MKNDYLMASDKVIDISLPPIRDYEINRYRRIKEVSQTIAFLYLDYLTRLEILGERLQYLLENNHLEQYEEEKEKLIDLLDAGKPFSQLFSDPVDVT